MNTQILKLTLLAMQAEYDKNILENINDIIKEIYQTNDVCYKHDLNNYMKKQNAIYIPIYINDKLHSFYEISNPNNVGDVTSLSILSLVLSQMYTNILLNYSEIAINEYDLSTNVFNRNSFEKFKRKIYNTKYESICCIYVDINGLNEINNAYGHRQGDKVILQVANSIKKFFDDGNIYRVGGDEFVIILFNKDEDVVYEEVYKLKEELNNASIHISIGINHKKEVLDIEKFVDEADKRMFEDKQTFYKMHSKTLRKKYYK